MCRFCNAFRARTCAEARCFLGPLHCGCYRLPAGCRRACYNVGQPDSHWTGGCTSIILSRTDSLTPFLFVVVVSLSARSCALPCPAAAVPCPSLPCCALPCNALSCLPCPTLPCLALPYKRLLAEIYTTKLRGCGI